MAILAMDLGGTKLAAMLLSEDGTILSEQKTPLNKRGGAEVGSLIAATVKEITARNSGERIRGIGVAVPGISYQSQGTVWAPNIRGWDNYALRDEIMQAHPGVPVIVESDRACCVVGEAWKGAAAGCTNVIFIAVGTGIGAGILVDGTVLRGTGDIAGAMGWMALERPYTGTYTQCGCLESRASGNGIARVATELVSSTPGYSGVLKRSPGTIIQAEDVFEAFTSGDPLAAEVIQECITVWGMAVANLVSLFNPAKIIFGGGVFGPAAVLIDAVRLEAAKWAQPRAMQQVQLTASLLGSRAPLYGAARMVWRHLTN